MPIFEYLLLSIHMDRCYAKTSNGTNTTYTWDGYNIISESKADGLESNVSFYVWGLDLSQSLQGAGGVGGLLAVVENGTPYLVTADGNGNVTEYVDANGAVKAHYEYGPFGEISASSGDKRDDFTHRFSTKPFEEVTGLVRYELRDYSPELGRWPSRDPIGENGFISTHIHHQAEPLSTAKGWALFVHSYRRAIRPQLRPESVPAEDVAWSLGLVRASDMETVISYVFCSNDSISSVDWLGLAVAGTHYRQDWSMFGRDDLPMYPHEAIELYGTGFGFGPSVEDLWVGTTEGYEDTKIPRWETVLKEKTWGRMKYGSTKIKCCAATKADRLACADYFKHTWHKSKYIPLVSDCGSFVNTIIEKCCIFKSNYYWNEVYVERSSE